MPDERKTRVLTFLPREETVWRLAPFLSRSSMEVDRARSCAEALEIASRKRFDLLTVFLPLPDFEVDEFLAQLQQTQAGDNPVPTILLTHQSDLDLVNGLVIPASTVVNLDDRDEVLRSRVAQALGVAARLSLRIPVRLEVGVTSGRSFRFCETRNISRSGILISSGRPLPLGADFRFQLTLPYTYTPLAGFAEVVRHTDQTLEQTTGFGARYLELGKGDSERLEAYIRQELVDRSLSPDNAENKLTGEPASHPAAHDDHGTER